MTKIVAVCAVAVLAASAGCGTTGLRSDARRIDVAAGVYLRLPAGDELTQSFDATQVITARFDGESRSFEAHVEARPGKLTIVGLNAIGVMLFSIRYDGRELVASGVSEARSVRPEYVLADVLLSHWDDDWLEARLEGATLRTSPAARRVVRDGSIVIEIDYSAGEPWSGTASLVHHERGYTLRIENLAWSAT